MIEVAIGPLNRLVAEVADAVIPLPDRLKIHPLIRSAPLACPADSLSNTGLSARLLWMVRFPLLTPCAPPRVAGIPMGCLIV